MNERVKGEEPGRVRIYAELAGVNDEAPSGLLIQRARRYNLVNTPVNLLHSVLISQRVKQLRKR